MTAPDSTAAARTRQRAAAVRRRVRRHPTLRSRAKPHPAAHPAGPTPAPKPTAPTGVEIPDVAISLPPGGGGSPPDTSTTFGVNPPATTDHWLAGAGHAIMPGPAMTGTATEMLKLGYYAKRQMANTWGKISNIRTTIH